ncbi:MAG TPA: flagellar protein FlaG [Azospirillum sp.]|nr:flagellar protein FlaG [Azospirillum sp.]
MPSPVNGITGVNGERSPASADVVAEARQRQADRLRAAQAEAEKPTEVVEETAKSEAAADRARGDAIRPYRVKLNPETNRLVTEVLDTETGAVIMRIPPTYVDPAQRAEEAGAAPSADGELEA